MLFLGLMATMAALGLMSAIAVGMIFFFRRRGWLGSQKSPPQENGNSSPKSY